MVTGRHRVGPCARRNRHGELVESTFVSLDGVINDPQNWGRPYWDEEHASYARQLLDAADCLLLGRETSRDLRPSRGRRGAAIRTPIGSMRCPSSSPHGRSARRPGTRRSSATSPPRSEGLKEQPGQDILKFGTGQLDGTLMEHGLVDEFHFWVFPVIVGQGQRLLDGVVDVTHLRLLRTTSMASGIVVHVYGPK